jgi:hypothetical protein
MVGFLADVMDPTRHNWSSGEQPDRRSPTHAAIRSERLHLRMISIGTVALMDRQPRANQPRRS